MHVSAHKVLPMALVLVTEATRTVGMEKLGICHTLDKLLNARLQTSTVATDRHKCIRKLLADDYPEINHQI